MRPYDRRFAWRAMFAPLALIGVLAGGLAIAGPAAAQAPCTCRAAGVSFDLDACTCLDTPAGPRRACCGKVLNNTAWKFTGEACPTAQAPGSIAPPGATPARTTQPPETVPATPWRAAEIAR